MKSTKSCKILLLLSTLFIALIMAFAGMNFSVASADETVKGSDYFTLSGSGSSAIELDGAAAVFTVKEGDVLKFKNKLLVKNIIINSTVPSEVTKFALKITADSFYVNGNKKVDGDSYEMVKEIENVFTFEKSDSGYTMSSEGFSSVRTIPSVGYFTIENINGFLNVNGNMIEKDEYRISESKFADCSIAIEFLELAADTAEYRISSVRMDDKEQNFTLHEGQFNNIVDPTVVLPAALRTTVAKNTEITVSYTQYSVLGESKDLYIKSNESDGIDVRDNKIVFRKSGDVDLRVYYKDGDIENEIYYERIAVKENEKNDASVPTYNNDGAAIQNFKDAYMSKLKDNDTGTYVALGSNQYLTLPSLEDLISDDVNAYSELKLTVYYTTPNSSSSSTTLRIPLSDAGEYSFYVVAQDTAGNKMDYQKDFRYEDNDGNLQYGVYQDYIFTFFVEDNYPIKVEAAKQGTGYVNVSYTATSFDITSSAYSTEYTLYYSATEIGAADEGWIEIPKASDITDTDYSENGYSYDDIQAIAYNGSTTFTPNKTGFYKIDCTVTSTVSNRMESAQVVINIKEQPKVVVVDNHWLENNVWSVVFLSVGTLCLIGIIVLLCIKPKEEENE